MTFEVPPHSYAQFMGRYADPLAVVFADLAALERGHRAVDVGCGPGALTAELARRLGPDAISAVDPSQSFVAAVRDRLPGVRADVGVAERLPFPDGSFDAALAQLVVHFMTDPAVGLREMARVTRRGGRVAACTWDQGATGSPMAIFYQAVHDLDPHASDESAVAGARAGHLVELFATAGLRDVEQSVLTVSAHFETFDEWWHPYTLGVGRAGAYVAALDDDRRSALRARCAELSPPAPFDVVASAWAVVAQV